MREERREEKKHEMDMRRGHPRRWSVSSDSLHDANPERGYFSVQRKELHHT